MLPSQVKVAVLQVCVIWGQANYNMNALTGFVSILILVLLAVILYVSVLIQRLENEKSKAQKANDSKSEFLAKMSHEIRTPLTAIMGYINLVSRSANLTESEKQQLSIAKNSSNILLNLVNDILDFSKIEAGKMQLVDHPVNVRTMIGNVANIVQITAEQKNLSFDIDMSENLPEYIMGDQRRLEQILINVLSNSVKFTDEGRIYLKVGSSHYEDHVRINYTVEDTGKGMEQTYMENIFSAFEQEDNSISRSYGGTGLGLYITKEFVEKMGGEIHVMSSLGAGTIFSFHTLHDYATKPGEKDRDAHVWTTENLKDKMVLLAEDNDINQLIIKDILLSLGMKVVVTTDGMEALRAARSSFDYILLDIQMPVLDGISTLKKIRARKELAHIPVIALTANVLPDQIDSYFNEGFDGFCSKPIEVNELIEVFLNNYTGRS